MSQSLKHGRGAELCGERVSGSGNGMYKGPEVGMCLQLGGESEAREAKAECMQESNSGQVDEGADRPGGAL